jgi:hypothetical protein
VESMHDRWMNRGVHQRQVAEFTGHFGH